MNERRRVLAVNNSSDIPIELYPDDFLYFNGNPYVMTDIVPTSDMSFEYSFYVSMLKSASNCISAYDVFLVGLRSNGFYYKFGNGTKTITGGPTQSRNKIYNVSIFRDADHSKIIINNTVSATDTMSIGNNSGYSFCIGSYAGNPSNGNYSFVGGIGALDIYKGENLAYSLVPAFRGSVYGFYDTVNSKFYPPATGTNLQLVEYDAIAHKT